MIGPEERASLQSVRSHAELHRVGRAELERRFEAREPVLDPGCCCELPFGFRVVFTIEQHPAGWARHLSVSTASEGRLPNSHALKMVGRELGMRMDIFDASTTSYLEGDPPLAVNVIEPIEPPTVDLEVTHE